MNSITTEHNSPYTGPAWDNSSEYPSLEAAELSRDIARAKALIAQICEKSPALHDATSRLAAESSGESYQHEKSLITLAQELTQLGTEAKILLGNVKTYLTCILSVDGRNREAKAKDGALEPVISELRQALQPIEIFLARCSEADAARYLEGSDMEQHRFAVGKLRQHRHLLLSAAEEQLLAGLETHGPVAFGQLYQSLSTSASCTIKGEDGEKKELGLAAAASLLQHENPNLREQAYRGIENAWRVHEDSCAAILNALSGWRHEVYKRRGRGQYDFLDQPLRDNNIERGTLDAMMNSVSDFRATSQRVIKAQASGLKQKTLKPWDLLAPCPKTSSEQSESRLSFSQGIALVKDAFAGVHPDMADFVQLMVDQRWIEGTTGSSKRPGAFCTKFLKSRTPRVYMTYEGGMRDVKTLAHELGHAYHNWVMRDMPVGETLYPMTLAETASIFAETVVDRHLTAAAGGPAATLACRWGAAREVEGLLINVAARFDFERTFYEKRVAGPLNPDELKSLMRETLHSWYGEALDEVPEMFWASKLHFSIAGLSFYNFPYIFGYLFALGVYAKKDALGDAFHGEFVALLRDTARMNAETLAEKHLGVDLTGAAFWQQGLAIAAQKVIALEDSVKSLEA